MKSNILIVIIALISATVFGQVRKEWGAKFDYDQKNEQDPKVVLLDNYNHYMLTVINVDGMQATNQIILRKFDQKNNLVNTFVQEFPNKDMFTLHNYMGSFEIGTDKVVVFTDTYSNKTKKKEIHKVVFDKKSQTFTTTLVVGYTFESISKSGTANVFGSQNGAFIAVTYQKFSNRKIAEETECTVLDGKTLDIAWKKTLTMPLELYTDTVVVTNSGKLVFVKRVVDKSAKHSLSIVDANATKETELGLNIKINKPITFSIGTQDYFVAFSSSATQRINIYDSILLYDLQSGTILKNNPIKDFAAIKDLQEIKYDYLNVQNNEIHLFVECKYQTGTRPDPKFPTNPGFNIPVFSNGNATLFVLDTEGNLKKSVNLNVYPTNDNLVGCVGIINYQGNYFVNAGNTNDTTGRYTRGFYKLEPNTFTPNNLNYQYAIPYNEESIDFRFGTSINQFCHYFPDNKRMLMAASYGDGKVAFLSFFGSGL
jgi:hypothetical protein